MIAVRTSWVALAVLLAGTAHAEDAPQVRTLLADPAQLAAWLRDHDPSAIGSREKVIQADELAQQARVLPNPQAQLGINGMALGGGNRAMGMTGPSGFFDTTDYSIGISELIELGKRGPRKGAADLRVREASEGAVGSLGGRVNDATTTLGKLAYAAAKRAIVAQNLEAAQKLQASEKIRADKQDLAGLDFARIELDTEALEIELTRADADLAVAVASCSATLFAACSADGLDASALDGAAPLPGSLPDVSAAIAERPEHQVQKLEATALGQDAVLADHRKIPDPTVGLVYDYSNYQFGGSLPQVLSVQVGFALPFFDRGNHDAAAARANARALQAQDQALVRAERGQAEAFVAQRGALEQTLDRLEKQSVPKTQKIVENTRKAFDLGQSGLAELLLAERQRRDLLAQVLDTRFDLFNIRVSIREQLGLDDQAARSAGAHK